MKKLRMLQMTEADTKLPMRTFLGKTMDDKVKEDERISRHDHGSRKGCSIEKSLLEKRLTFDHAKKTEDVNVGTISGLEACYHQ